MFELLEEYIEKLNKDKIDTIDFLAEYFKYQGLQEPYVLSEKKVPNLLGYISKERELSKQKKIISLFKEVCNEDLLSFDLRYYLIKDIRNELFSIGPEEFEKIGEKIIHKYYGAKCFKVTSYTKDGGYDFYGEVYLKDFNNNIDQFLYDHPIEIYGQAKKYSSNIVRPDIDMYLGFSYKMQNSKHFKPIIYLFITTASFSRESLKTGNEFGIFMKDGDQIAQIIFDTQKEHSKTSKDFIENFLL